MKRWITAFLCLMLMLSVTGCKSQKSVNDIDGNIKAYAEMSDGTWQCGGNTYKYRLEISGTMPNADKGKITTFVYLSNMEEITFEQAWKAAGLSSNSEDYFAAKDAVVVEIRTA